ncbi:Coiled-coil domain-containing protein 6 [Halotydeus destructor]|nr:Coiled-coil domain-containing protein 6 [Halotydeus destructor]
MDANHITRQRLSSESMASYSRTSTPSPMSSLSPLPPPLPPGDPNSPTTKDMIIKRLDHENRHLKFEIENLKHKLKQVTEENNMLRAASVTIQAKAEQEEEYISNTLLKKIQVLKKEKETLALNYEQEEEHLTNDLSRKLNQLRAEKTQLEKTLEHEQSDHSINSGQE